MNEPLFLGNGLWHVRDMLDGSDFDPFNPTAMRWRPHADPSAHESPFLSLAEAGGGYVSTQALLESGLQTAWLWGVVNWAATNRVIAYTPGLGEPTWND